MRLLERWLEEFPPSQTILDLGCGPGSLPAQLAGFQVTGVDVDWKALGRDTDRPQVCAESHRLPFAGESFDLIICNHSLEHIHDVQGTIREIARVLRPAGRLFITVPDGASLSDHLYRLLLCGGGHAQRFHFDGLVGLIEAGTGLHLAAWKELSSSFLYVNKRNFLPAPRGPLPGPFPRRMRWLSHLPSPLFSGARMALNVATRTMDRYFRTRTSQYGWALAFGPDRVIPQQEPGHSNVCMFCGAGFDGEPGERISWLLYRCPYCSGSNFRFPSH